MLELWRKFQTAFSTRRRAPGNDSTGCLDWMDGVDVLHVCDACEPTRHGTLHRYTWDAGRLVDARRLAHPQWASSEVHVTLNSLRGGGSHDFGVRDVLRLAAETRLLPNK